MGSSFIVVTLVLGISASSNALTLDLHDDGSYDVLVGNVSLE